MKETYIVWTSNGYYWSKSEYEDLKSAIEHESYGSEKIVTKVVKYKITEVEEIN